MEAAGEAVKHDLGRVVVLAVLGRPAAGTDLAFQRYQRAFAGTALDHINQSFVPDDDAVPFGAFLTFGDLAGGKAEGRHAAAAGGCADFGIAAQAADGDEALVHGVLLTGRAMSRRLLVALVSFHDFVLLLRKGGDHAVLRGLVDRADFPDADIDAAAPQVVQRLQIRHGGQLLLQVGLELLDRRGLQVGVALDRVEDFRLLAVFAVVELAQIDVGGQANLEHAFADGVSHRHLEAFIIGLLRAVTVAADHLGTAPLRAGEVLLTGMGIDVPDPAADEDHPLGYGPFKLLVTPALADRAEYLGHHLETPSRVDLGAAKAAGPLERLGRLGIGPLQSIPEFQIVARRHFPGGHFPAGRRGFVLRPLGRLGHA